MSREHPTTGCIDVDFALSLALGDAAEVALEDYARTVAGAAEAEVVADAEGRVAGVHLCGAAAPTGPLAAEVEGFALDLAQREESARGRP